MRITTANSRSGIAIIIVMISIFTLAVLAAAFAMSMKVETRLATYAKDESEMEWLGRSGVEMARYVLGQEVTQPGPGQRFDALNQKWAGGTGETNEILAALSLENVPVGRGTFTVKITDNERKFNINGILGNEAILNQALLLIGADAADVPSVINCVQDWLDRDDDPHLNGAESEYYSSLEIPYLAKNGPIDDMSEMLFIRGITPDVFWGPNAPKHPATLFQPRKVTRSGLLPSTPQLPVGLVDLFTSISSGQVNMNTASAATFQILGMDRDAADRLVSLRAGPDGVEGTDDDVPFTNTGEIVNAIPNQALATQFMRMLTLRSSTFDVQVDAQLGQFHRRYHALLKRNSGQEIQVLDFRWE